MIIILILFFNHAKINLMENLKLQITEILPFTDVFFKIYFKKLTFKNYIGIENMYQITCFDKSLPIAVLIFKVNENNIFIYYTLVIPEYRNKGINTLMLKQLDSFAQQQNINLLMCNVRESNVISLKSFTNNGFQINKNYNLKYKNGENKISMFKEL